MAAEKRSSYPVVWIDAEKKRTVLVVDDDESVLDVVSHLVSGAGYHVLTVRNVKRPWKRNRRKDNNGRRRQDFAHPFRPGCIARLQENSDSYDEIFNAHKDNRVT